jgi:hypothetical protein
VDAHERADPSAAFEKGAVARQVRRNRYGQLVPHNRPLQREDPRPDSAARSPNRRALGPTNPRWNSLAAVKFRENSRNQGNPFEKRPRRVWRSMPPILAASSREAPSSTAAVANSRRGVPATCADRSRRFGNNIQSR